MINLGTIIELAAIESASSILLSAQTKVVIETALAVIEDLSLWYGDEAELTAVEIDTIQNIIATAYRELYG